jgi:hypothetical protein
MIPNNIRSRTIRIPHHSSTCYNARGKASLLSMQTAIERVSNPRPNTAVEYSGLSTKRKPKNAIAVDRCNAFPIRITKRTSYINQELLSYMTARDSTPTQYSVPRIPRLRCRSRPIVQVLAQSQAAVLPISNPKYGVSKMVGTTPEGGQSQSQSEEKMCGRSQGARLAMRTGKRSSMIRQAFQVPSSALTKTLVPIPICRQVGPKRRRHKFPSIVGSLARNNDLTSANSDLALDNSYARTDRSHKLSVDIVIPNTHAELNEPESQGLRRLPTSDNQYANATYRVQRESRAGGTFSADPNLYARKTVTALNIKLLSGR